ncbi:unnamed protein product [Scytosiphon promiscuus]
MAVLVETSAIVVETVEGTPVVVGSAEGNTIGVVAVVDTPEEESHEEPDEERRHQRPVSPRMKAPHISTLYEKQDVMVKHFGVTQKQALRTQALLRLGVTDEDVRIAERLMGSRREGSDTNTHSKEEWLLGVTYAQMSFHKALQVLGISEAVVEEERARRLGELGFCGWASNSYGLSGQEGDGSCGGFFTKRRRSSDQELGTTLSGEVAFAPTHTRVLQLEEVCQTQMTRIQELESQLAALSARPSPSSS